MSQLLPAATAGDAASLQRALQSGESVSLRDDKGSTALHLAAKGGHGACLQLLVQHGADVNEQHTQVGATALVYAAQANHKGAVQLLLQLRARPDMMTRKGKTALTVAQEKGWHDIAALLQGASECGAASAPAPAALSSPFGAGGAFGAGQATPAAFGSGGGFAASTTTSFGGAAGAGGAATPFGVTATPSPFGAPAAAAAPAPSAFGASSGLGGLGASAFGAGLSLGGASLGGGSIGALGAPAAPAAAPKAAPFGAATPTALAFGGSPLAGTPAAFGAASTGSAAAGGSAAGAKPPQTTTLPSPPEDSVSALAFSGTPQHELLAASAWDGSVRIWSLRQGGTAAEHVLTYTHTAAALCVCSSPNGERVVSGGADCAVRTLDVASASLDALGEHASPVVSLAATPQHASCVFSASLDSSIACWDMRAPGRAASSVRLPERAYALDVQWPYALVATAAKGLVCLIDMRQQTPQQRSVSLPEQLASYAPRCVALLPSGAPSAAHVGCCVGSYDGRVGLIHDDGAGVVTAAPPPSAPDASKLGVPYQFECHRAKGSDGAERAYAVHQLAFDPRHQALLATAGGDGQVLLWDLHKRKQLAQLVEPAADGVAVPAIAYGREGEMLAFARSDEWCGGAARYQSLRAAGRKGEVCIAHCTSQWLREATARQ